MFASNLTIRLFYAPVVRVVSVKGIKVGDIVRLYKRTFCVLNILTDYVELQSMDEERWFITVPRTKLGGLKRGV